MFRQLHAARSLTPEQAKAACSGARRTLVLAAAGSGKTATLVARVAHALITGQCRNRQVLALAFNTRAAAELRVRLDACLAPAQAAPHGLQARTLHALGLSIITRVEGRRPHVQDAGRLLAPVLAGLVAQDVPFFDHWLMFRLFYPVCVRHPCEFSGRRQWRRHVREQGSHNGRRAGFATRRGELLPTQFEQAIADWLDLHGLDYRYRRVAGWVSPWSGPLSGRRGFFLPAQGLWVVCCAHGAGEPSGRRLVLPAYSFRDASAFGLLRQWLQAQGIALSGPAQVLARLGEVPGPVQWRFLKRFVALARLAGKSAAQLHAAVPACRDASRARLHAPMLGRLCTAYAQALHVRQSIDFEGMLHRAADYLQTGRFQHGWTLILVDEFQDTSAGGVRLLQALLASRPDCRLFAVGDDWQSIYRFAGAMPDALRNFGRRFGQPEVLTLGRSFRFSQPLADAATAFIQQNPQQLRKRVTARPDPAAAIVLVPCEGAASMPMAIHACLSAIARQAGGGKRLQVFLLGRYQHQHPPALGRWSGAFPGLDIRFHTIHAVKGLEADAVIVLGLQAGRHGFPCERSPDPLLDLVLPQADAYPCAEERRLFYVALTRSRSRAYLVVDAQNPSPFVAELQYLEACRPAADRCAQPWLETLDWTTAC